MANYIGGVTIRIGADTKALAYDLKVAERQLTALGNKFKSVGQSLSIGLTLPIVAFGASSVKAFSDSAQAVGQVEAALKSTKNTAGKTSDGLQKVAADLQKISRFDDDEILKKVTANLLTFTSVSGDTFDRAQVSILNLSERLGTDLQSATLLVGKALNDPVNGMTALKRAGIQLSDSQKDLIKNLVATGDVAGAQAIILKELETQFGGSAEAAAKLGLGPLQQLKNQFGDLQESFGKIIFEALSPFIEKLKGAIEWVSNLSDGQKKLIVQVAAVAAAIGPAIYILGSLITQYGAVFGAIRSIIALSPTLATALITSLGPISIAIVAIAAASYLVYTNWDLINQKWKEAYYTSTLFRTSVNGISAAATAIYSEFRSLLKIIGALASAADGLFKVALGEGSYKDVGKKLGAELKKITEENIKTKSEALNSINAPTSRADLYKGFSGLKNAGPTGGTSIIDNIVGLDDDSINNTKNKARSLVKEIESLVRGEKLDTSTGAKILNDVSNNSAFKNLGSFDQRAQGILNNKRLSVSTASLPLISDQNKLDSERLATISPKIDTTELEAGLERSKALTIDYSTQISQLGTAAFATLGDALGDLFTGKFKAETFFNSMLGLLGGFAKQIGKTIIAIGLASEALKTAFANPFVAIAAGTALIALGSILESQISKGVPSLAIGTDYVQRDGLAQIHRGEAIVPAKVVQGGFTGGAGERSGQLYSVVRGDDLWLIEQNNISRSKRFR